MNKKLIKVATYLKKQGFVKEASQIEKIAGVPGLEGPPDSYYDKNRHELEVSVTDPNDEGMIDQVVGAIELILNKHKPKKISIHIDKEKEQIKVEFNTKHEKKALAIENEIAALKGVGVVLPV